MDWIDQFVIETRTIRAPEQFRRWSAIAAIAGMLERRVWTQTDVAPLYPNFYIILVGEPASGKTNSVREARKTLASISDLKLGPDNPTRASFLDQLEAAQTKGLMPTIAMTVVCEEFGVFIPSYDEAFLSDLTKLYDNPESYSAPRRSSKSVKLERPTLNILACATPAVIGKFPESAWGEGFTSRVMFIGGSRPETFRDPFKKRENLDLKELKIIIEHHFYELRGEFEWDEQAREQLTTWVNSGMKPRPTHGRLENYTGRRDIHLMKLSMISAVSAGHGLNVTLDDYMRAREWLLEAETKMPDVFRAAVMKTDKQTVEDLHHAMYVEYSKLEQGKRKPIIDAFLWQYLEQRVPGDRIQKIIDLAEKTGRIRKADNGFAKSWTPNPRDQFTPGE